MSTRGGVPRGRRLTRGINGGAPSLSGLLLAVFVIVLVLAGVTQALSALGGRSAGGPDRAGPDQLLPPSAAQRQQLTVAQAGRPAGYLTIPAIGITHVAIYDRGLDEQRQMLIAPGRAVTRYASSSPLNGTSNTVLYGHDDIQGSVFARLADLRAGDTITVVTSGTSRVYVVQGGPSIVSPTDLAILTPTATPRLTLFSCYPINVDSQRVVVVAAPAPVTSPR